MNIYDQLKRIKKHSDNIHGHIQEYESQNDEIQLRKKVAVNKYSNYLLEVSKHHSIPVMDVEVKRFLKNIPPNGLILDIGGCWGWHWRNIEKIRPDVKIIILDLVRENFEHTKNILNNLLNKSIFLVHGNAVSLDFDSNTFDGIWSVQATQHIPNYNTVFMEAFRVLKTKGYFSDYSLHNAPLIRMIYKLFNKHYHVEGFVNGYYYLRRPNKELKIKLLRIFENQLITRYTEILFSPAIRLPIGGKDKSIFGMFDALLSGNSWFNSLVARQISIHIHKP